MAPRSRQTAVRTERRNRDAGTLDRLQRNKLALPAEFRGDTDHTYRWVNDVDNRIHDLTVDGEWDVCTTANPETSEEVKLFKPVGTKDTGEPLYAYLCRQPKQFYDEDQAAKVDLIGETEKLALSGQTPSSELGDAGYASKGNTIKRGYSP